MAGRDFLRGSGENNSVDDLPEPKLDEVYSLLANRRRRCLLHMLTHRDMPRFWLSNLALELAEHEDRASTTDNDPSCDRIMVELHHNHLPTLADAGVIDYDPERKTGQYVGDPAIESLLEWEQSDTAAIE